MGLGNQTSDIKKSQNPAWIRMHAGWWPKLFGLPHTVLDLKLKICECDMSLQTVESEGSTRKKEKEDRDDLRSENCSIIDMIRVEEDQLVLLELGP